VAPFKYLGAISASPSKIDHSTEQFRRPLPLQNTGELLTKSPAAGPAEPFPSFQDQETAPHSPRLMPHRPKITTLAPQLVPAAIRTGDRPAIAGPIRTAPPLCSMLVISNPPSLNTAFIVSSSLAVVCISQGGYLHPSL